MNRIPLFLSCLLMLLSCGKEASVGVSISSEAELPGHTVTTLAGSYYDTKYSKVEGVRMFRVSAEADGIEAVRKGIADVFVGDETMLGTDDLKRTGLRKAFLAEESFPCAYMFRKGDSELLPAFNEFLAVMKSDGTLDAYIAHWLSDGPEVPYPPKAEITDPTPIRYCSCLTTAPVSFIRNGEWTGLDVDLVRRFAAWYGRPLEVSNVALASAIVAVQTGQADIVSGCIFATDERRQRVDFSDTYFFCHPGFFMKDASGAASEGFFQRAKNLFVQSFLVDRRWKLITDGLWTTILITLLAIIFGSVLGVLYCALALSRRKWMRQIARGYDFIIQGIPQVVLLLIMFYVVFANTGVASVVVAIITFALIFASSAGNVFASSVSSVPRGQWEAGYALGFTGARTFRWIVFPQAVKKGIGAYTSNCITLLKGTSIVGYIAVQDLTRASDLLRSRTFDAFMPLLVVTLLYFLLAWLLRLLLNLLKPKSEHD